MRQNFLSGAGTQTITSQSPHYYRQGAHHWSESSHTHIDNVRLALLLAGTIDSSYCDWLHRVLTPAWAGFVTSSERCGLQGDKGHSGTRKRYPLAAGATELCSAVYHLTLHNWVHASTKWRWLWRPTDKQGRVYQRERRRRMLPVTCTVLPPCCVCLCGEKRTNWLIWVCGGFCLHFLLFLYNTMVIGRSGRVCIWCNKPTLHHPNPLLLFIYPAPHPVESSLKDLLLMS